jgi:hypothetical protein
VPKSGNYFDLERYLNICDRHFLYTLPDIVQTIIWSLTHYAESNEENRNKMLRSKVFDSILDIGKETGSGEIILQQCNSFFANLLNPEYKRPSSDLVQTFTDIAIKSFMRSSEPESLICALSVLINVTDANGTDNLMAYIISQGVLDKILNVVPHIPELQHSFICILGNLLAIDDSNQVEVI